MTIKDCIDIVDNIKPNQYTIKEKVMWLSFIEAIIINEVLKTHEGYDGRYDDFEGYSEDKISTSLIVPSPYDRLYTAYLKMKIDEENGETTRYNNSAALYNTYMMEYRKHYNKTHMPIDTKNPRKANVPQRANVGLSDAEYENLKKDMTYILTEYFSGMLSNDKIYDIVKTFVLNNTEMLKGAVKSEITPIKEKVDLLYSKSIVKTVAITLPSYFWVKESANKYSQIVSIEGITPYSKVDLQPTAEQLTIFHEKDIAFVTENDGGVITIYCIGQKPNNSYTIQATITEVN